MYCVKKVGVVGQPFESNPKSQRLTAWHEDRMGLNDHQAPFVRLAEEGRRVVRKVNALASPFHILKVLSLGGGFKE